MGSYSIKKMKTLLKFVFEGLSSVEMLRLKTGGGKQIFVK